MLLHRVGIKCDSKLRKSFLMSKYLTITPFDFPRCNRVRIIMPFFETMKKIHTKRVLLFLNFFESFTGIRPIITRMILIVRSGLWIRSEVNLSGFRFDNFWVFFNEAFFAHPFLRYSFKHPNFV